jgi:hypothetical protein
MTILKSIVINMVMVEMLFNKSDNLYLSFYLSSSQKSRILS